MSLQSKWPPRTQHKANRGDRVTWALMAIGGVVIVTVAALWPRQDRIAELELRLTEVESHLEIEVTANHLARLTGAVKRAECNKAVTGYAVDNKLIPGSISEVCALPRSEANKDASPETTQEQADDFIAKLLPTLEAEDPKTKKAVCENFTVLFQRENLKTPPAMNAACEL